MKELSQVDEKERKHVTYPFIRLIIYTYIIWGSFMMIYFGIMEPGSEYCYTNITEATCSLGCSCLCNKPYNKQCYGVKKINNITIDNICGFDFSGDIDECHLDQQMDIECFISSNDYNIITEQNTQHKKIRIFASNEISYHDGNLSHKHHCESGAARYSLVTIGSVLAFFTYWAVLCEIFEFKE